MTNKIQKIRQEVEKLKSNLIHGACSSQVAMETRCKEEAYNEVLALFDTMQEQHVKESAEIQHEDKSCEDNGNSLTKEPTSWLDEFRAKLDYLLKKVFEKVWKKYETEEKEEPVNNELEEAAKHYLYSNILYDDVYVGNPTDKDCIEMFKAGAEWQKRQDYFKIIYPRIITKGTIEQYAYQVAYDMSNDWAIDNPTWNDVENACKLGAKWKEQQMMKNSISKSVCLSLTGPYVELDQDDIHQLGLLFGDKIKLIVIKED